MKNGDGAFVQAYNGQAVVDEAEQIVVAADVTTCASDAPSLAPMLGQAEANAGRSPAQALVDAGYCSEDNHGGPDTLIATGRVKHGKFPPPSPEQLPPTATERERMASRLRTETGRADYVRRKAIVEPVFGQASTRQNGKQLLLRGENGARRRCRRSSESSGGRVRSIRSPPGRSFWAMGGALTDGQCDSCRYRSEEEPMIERVAAVGISTLAALAVTAAPASAVEGSTGPCAGSVGYAEIPEAGPEFVCEAGTAPGGGARFIQL